MIYRLWRIRTGRTFSQETLAILLVFVSLSPNSAPTVRGEGGPITSQTQNRQGFGPFGSNIPNDVNAGRPFVVRSPIVNYDRNSPKVPESSLPIGVAPDPSKSVWWFNLLGRLTDDPEDDLPEVVNSVDHESARPQVHGGWSWHNWIFVGLTVCGGVLAFARRRLGLSVAAVGIFLLAGSWLFDLNQQVPLIEPKNKAITKEPPAMDGATEPKNSVRPIPDFDAFKERLTNPYPFFREQAVRNSIRFGEKAYPHLLAAFSDRSGLVRESVKFSLRTHAAPALLIGSQSKENTELREFALGCLKFSGNPGEPSSWPMIVHLPPEVLKKYVGHPDPETNETLLRIMRGSLRAEFNVPHIDANQILEDALFAGKMNRNEFFEKSAQQHVPDLLAKVNARWFSRDRRLTAYSAFNTIENLGPFAAFALDDLKELFWKIGSLDDERPEDYRSLVYSVSNAIAETGGKGLELLSRCLTSGKMNRDQKLAVFTVLRSAGERHQEAKKVINKEFMSTMELMLNQENDSELRNEVIYTLAEFGDIKALELILERPIDESNDTANLTLLRGKGRLRTGSHPTFAAVKEASERIKRSAHARVRLPFTAVYELLKYPERFANAKELLKLVSAEFYNSEDFLKAVLLTDGDVNEVFGRQLDGIAKNKEISVVNVEKIASYGPAIVPQVRKALREKKGPRTRAFLLAVLDRIGPYAADAAPDVIRQTKSRKKLLRLAALSALEKIYSFDMDSLAVLMASVRDPDPEVRELALGALCRFEDNAAPALHDVIVALKSENQKERSAAINLVRHIGPAANSAIDMLGHITSKHIKD